MENSSYRVLHLKPAIQKTTNQLNYVPKIVKKRSWRNSWYLVSYCSSVTTLS